jgi:D-alanyl-D-alanine carboxypeptidase
MWSHLYKHPYGALLTQSFAAHGGNGVDTQTRGSQRDARGVPAFISINITDNRPNPSPEVEQTREGRMLVSAIKGKVITAVSNYANFRQRVPGGYGNQVTIQGEGEDSHLRMRYAHLHEVFVTVGQEVSRGQVIGTEGDTGTSTGQHLHLECYNNGRIFDPFATWFPSNTPPVPGASPAAGAFSDGDGLGEETFHQLQTGELLPPDYSYPWGPTDMAGIYKVPTTINFGYAAHPGSLDWNRYGLGFHHRGFDSSGVKTEDGLALHTPSGGRVVAASIGNNGGFGNTVVIEISPTEWIRFAHLASIAVSVGDIVTAGTCVGVEGNTPGGMGVHLHFEYMNMYRLSSSSVRRFNGIHNNAWSADPFTWITGIQSREAPWSDGWQEHVTPPSGGSVSSRSRHTKLPAELFLVLPKLTPTIMKHLENIVANNPDLIRGLIVRADETQGYKHNVRTLTLDNDIALGTSYEMTKESANVQAMKLVDTFRFYPLSFGLFCKDSKSMKLSDYEMLVSRLRDNGFIRQGFITSDFKRNAEVRNIEAEELRPLVMLESPTADLADRLQAPVAARESIPQSIIYNGMSEVEDKPPLVLLQGGLDKDGLLTSNKSKAIIECAIAAVSDRMEIGIDCQCEYEEDEECVCDLEYAEGDYVDIPNRDGIGEIMSYMGLGHLTSSESIAQGRLKNRSTWKAPEGYAMVDGRISVAVLPNIGNRLPCSVGDYLDVTYRFSNGETQVFKCIMGDAKAPASLGGDATSIWGHQNGVGPVCVVEMIYYTYDKGYSGASLPHGNNNPINNPWEFYKTGRLTGGRVTRIAKVGRSPIEGGNGVNRVERSTEDNWALWLINSTNPLPVNYAPSLSTITGTVFEFDSRGIADLHSMLAAIQAAGLSYSLASAYRRISTQETNFRNYWNSRRNEGYTAERAFELTAEQIAIPRTSEHNAGLAVDFNPVAESFDQTALFTWLTNNAHEYGFILRYPKNTKAITGIIYEPWHWRYVGKGNAKKVKDSGKVLELYIGTDANDRSAITSWRATLGL